MAEITYDILKALCVLNDSGKGWTKEVNVVRWNDGPSKLDIREWDHKNNKMKKGITLYRDEVEKLKSLLDKLNFDKIDERVANNDEDIAI